MSILPAPTTGRIQEGNAEILLIVLRMSPDPIVTHEQTHKQVPRFSLNYKYLCCFVQHSLNL